MKNVERNSRRKGSNEIVICFAGNNTVSSRKDSIRMTDRETISTRAMLHAHPLLAVMVASHRAFTPNSHLRQADANSRMVFFRIPLRGHL